MCIMLLKDNRKEVNMMLTATKEIRMDTEKLIELLKKLPESKQNFVNGYVQGVSETLTDKEKSA